MLSQGREELIRVFVFVYLLSFSPPGSKMAYVSSGTALFLKRWHFEIRSTLDAGGSRLSLLRFTLKIAKKIE